MTKEERAYNYASTRKTTKFQVGEIAKFYNDGYEQAEKDLALTWEDIKMIFTIADNYDSEFDRPHIGSDAYYQEILRRFNEQKERM